MKTAVLLSRSLLLLATLPSCGRALIDLNSDRSDAPTRAAPSPDALAGAAVANRFALNLLTALDRRAGSAANNAAFAPTSLEAALSMVAKGAAGTTRDGMLEAMGFGGTAADPLAASAAVLRSLAFTGSPTTKLAAADRVWAQTGLKIVPEYARALDASFAVAIGDVDFHGDPEAARGAINAWAAERTDGLVKELFPAGAINELSRLVTADALLIDAVWKNPFDPKLSAPRPFAVPGGTVQVTTMRQVGAFPFAADARTRVVELPLAGDRLALDVFVPVDGTASLAAPDIQAALAALVGAGAKPQPVAVELPAFSTATALRLDAELQRLGMGEAFTDRADFSNMVQGMPLSLGGVMQQVAVQVNERGTRAGIASGAVVEHRLALQNAVEFRADRPFVYIVRDRDTGAFLIVGRVADPTKT